MTILVDLEKVYRHQCERILALLINLNRLHSDVLCVNFAEMGPVVQEKRCLNVVMYFRYHYFFEKSVALHFNIMESFGRKKPDKKR